jgi:hypothetical protein
MYLALRRRSLLLLLLPRSTQRRVRPGWQERSRRCPVRGSTGPPHVLVQVQGLRELHVGVIPCPAARVARATQHGGASCWWRVGPGQILIQLLSC